MIDLFLRRLGLFKFRDISYLEMIISKFKKGEIDEIRYEKIAEMLDRDVSTVRKRIGKILDPIEEESLKDLLKIDKKSATKKQILEEIINASRDI